MRSGRFGRKSPGNTKRPSYLRYDDVFMSKSRSSEYDYEEYDDSPKKAEPPRMANRNSFQPIRRDPPENPEYEDDSVEDREYFSRNGRNIIDERMVKYRKRQLPPLQRYDQESRGMYGDYESSDWDGYGYDDRRRSGYGGDGAVFKSIWRKFLITFGGIFILVCVSWIAYNCGGGGSSSQDKHGGEPVIIEPETSTFKVLPDNHGGMEIPHQDKMVYDKISPAGVHPDPEQDQLLPPQELPTVVEECSILDERTYYIKLASNKNKSVLINEVGILKNKFSRQISSLSCSIKTVKDKDGEKRYAVLVGPLCSKEEAIQLARALNTDCSVIAVVE